MKMQLIQRVRNCAAATLLAMGAIQVQAVPLSFNLEWEEIGGGGGTATAKLTLETDHLNNLGPNFLVGPVPGLPGSNALVDFEMTIGGASDYAGSSYSMSDFSFMLLDFTSPVDLASQLVGQAGFNDFNLSTFDSSGPTAQAPNTFALFNNFGTEDYELKSFKVPEPTPMLLLIIGLVGLGAVRMKRNRMRHKLPS